jgi:hypothetical protein
VGQALVRGVRDDHRWQAEVEQVPAGQPDRSLATVLLAGMILLVVGMAALAVTAWWWP